MLIPHERAKTTLRRGVEEANREPDDAERDWINIVETFSDAFQGDTPKTHIAFLGTAILAKATEPGADVYAVKVRAGTEGAYSARSLATHVLVPLAQEFEIDLGVYGREPLNNQPYFRIDRVTEDEVLPLVRDPAPVRALLTVLEKLDPCTSAEAAIALRAFIRVRRRRVRTYPEPPVIQGQIPFKTLPLLAEQFVSSDSEGGKRAQAVSAGLIEAVLHEQSITTRRVNDPDRHFPGDVGVSVPDQQNWERVLEVRDKPVSEPDLRVFADKALRGGVRKAAVLGVSDRQTALDTKEVTRWALERGLSLEVYSGWWAFIAALASWTFQDPEAWLGRVPNCVRSRLIEMEVSVEGVEEWDQLIVNEVL